jgi:D-alanyl-lipoteichoic acid acyltransferase DltB (MBOAT superfamily)
VSNQLLVQLAGINLQPQVFFLSLVYRETLATRGLRVRLHTRRVRVIFNSLIFVVFFSIVLILHAMPFSWRAKKINLLIASYIFYAAWNPPFVILLWVSTVVDWFAARGLAQADDPWRRRTWMLLSVIVSLGLLCYFKYGHFLLENFVQPRHRSSLIQCRGYDK